MDRFSILPVEIRRLIGDYFTDPADFPGLGALAATSRSNFLVFNEQLYRADIAAAGTRPPLAMLWGATVGEIDTMECAFAHGANVNAYGTVGTPFPPPDPEGHPVYEVTMRQLRGDPSVSPRRLGTALHFAVIMGQDDAVEWLLDHGARLDVGAKSLCDCHPQGSREWQAWRMEGSWHPHWYPLHHALCYVRLSTFKLLVGRGASLDKLCAGRGRAGGYPPALHQAAYAGHWQIVDFILGLLDAQARVTATACGVTTLEAVYMGSGRGDRFDRAQVIRSLVNHGARLDDVATNGDRSPLLRACRCCNDFGLPTDFLYLGACPHVSNETLQAMLYHTLAAGRFVANDMPHITNYDPHPVDYPGKRGDQTRERIELVKLLVKMGATIDLSRYAHGSGDTAIMFAAHPIWKSNEASEMLKLVLKLGGDPRATNTKGMTVIHYFVQEVMVPRADWSLAPRAEYIVNVPTLAFIAKEGMVAFDAKDIEGRTAFDYIYDTAEHAINSIRTTVIVEYRAEELVIPWRGLAVQLVEALLFNAPKTPYLSTHTVDAEMLRLYEARSLLEMAKVEHERWIGKRKTAPPYMTLLPRRPMEL